MIRKKEKRKTPPISTASLPDIVFMLLCFFMVVTVMRETEQKVLVTYPQATELTKLSKKSLVTHIYIGPRIHRDKLASASSIQLNNSIASLDDISTFIDESRRAIDQKLQPAMITSLKVDSNTKMGIIYEVKQELRKADALKVNYSAVVRADDL